MKAVLYNCYHSPDVRQVVSTRKPQAEDLAYNGQLMQEGKVTVAIDRHGDLEKVYVTIAY